MNLPKIDQTARSKRIAILLGFDISQQLYRELLVLDVTHVTLRCVVCPDAGCREAFSLGNTRV
jgi:hypothetical protein